MPDTSAIIALAVVAAAMALFVSGKLRVDLIALCVLGSIVLLRLIEPGQALDGFASPATATVAAMFVLSAALVRTGIVQWLAARLDKLAGAGEPRLLLTLCIAIAAVSAFVINAATVAIFIPIAFVLARSRRAFPSKLLMPISFASQMGGVCTLIGSSTNILVNAIAIGLGMRSFGLFEFAPLGLILCAIGIVYLLLVARPLLPSRSQEVEQVDKYRLADYLAELTVKEKSPLIGKTWNECEAKEESGAQLIKMLRGEAVTWRPGATALAEGDVLLLHGDMGRLIEMKDKYGLELQSDSIVEDEELRSDEVKLVEALIPPQSRLIGRTLREMSFFRLYGSAVLALQRRGRVLRNRLSDTRLIDGDTLLIQGDADDVSRLMKSRSIIVTNELTEFYLRKDRAALALLVFVTILALAAFNVLPIVVAALLGAVAMVLLRCLSMEEAYSAIDWKVVFLLAGMIPLGTALDQSGAASWLAGAVLAPLEGLGPLAVLAAVYLLTAALTEEMSNTAAAVILAPIAITVAGSMNVDARPFLVAITFAASTSFTTPVGYQTNTMVFAPGGYRFGDYVRVGGPLNIIFWITAVYLIPKIWPF
jgi:di/tricarboxylate transporter